MLVPGDTITFMALNETYVIIAIHKHCNRGTVKHRTTFTLLSSTGEMHELVSINELRALCPKVIASA